MFTDTHCHLASSKFDKSELTELLQRAREAGVERCITLSTDLEDLQPNLSLARTYDEIYCAIGIHPCYVTQVPDNALDLVREALSTPEVVAVGETGLDYYHPAPAGWTETDYHARQRHFLDQHFQMAKEAGLNIVLHTRDRRGQASFTDCLAIYRKYAQEVRAVFHCFPGTVLQAEQVLALGGLVSFTGNVSFKNAQQIKETVKALPLGSFMLETDAPYLTPVPHRGKRNEPAYVADIVNAVCTLKQISPQELAPVIRGVEEAFFRYQ